MTDRPQVWILAGGNGAGKSTFYQQFLESRGIVFVNADVIAKVLSPDSPEEFSYKAAKRAEILRSQLLAERVNFCFETVFSHPSKIDFVAEAKAAGYEVILVYIHLVDENLNVARVSTRVAQGGHDVPTAKIRSRLPRTMKNVGKAIPLADEVLLLDNSSAENPYVSVARTKNGELLSTSVPLPEWGREVLGCTVSASLLCKPPG
jgi:predicted ABC-type ATPase